MIAPNKEDKEVGGVMKKASAVVDERAEDSDDGSDKEEEFNEKPTETPAESNDSGGNLMLLVGQRQLILMINMRT